ncbi:hypothetical protein BN1708_009302 [Verticillium longisporum]|uniref:Uncharacterized protein n=1 Tax=Verticillium longisporum TaxID=100787 RepID=A0A0G4KFI5_VERLO|nr:hypothetical protein BN1708_009302 [Verticillium longisporum]
MALERLRYGAPPPMAGYLNPSWLTSSHTSDAQKSTILMPGQAEEVQIIDLIQQLTSEGGCYGNLTPSLVSML